MSPVNIGDARGRAADDGVCALVGGRDVAGDLTRVRGAGIQVREHRARLIAVLLAQILIVDAASVDSRRGAGLQSADDERQLTQARGESIRRGIPGPSAGVAFEADMDLSAQERAHRQHHGTGPELDAAQRDASDYPLGLEHEVGGLLLEKLQVRLRLEQPADGALVELAIGLGPSGAYRRPLACVQGAQLDACLVRRDRHRAAERIDLLDQMTLADAADRGIAAHLPEGLDVVREQERAAAHACGRERRLGAGVAAADHDHVEFTVESHRHESQDFSSRGAYCKPSAAKVPGRRPGTGLGLARGLVWGTGPGAGNYALVR